MRKPPIPTHPQLLKILRRPGLFIRRPPLCGGNDSRHCTDDGRQYTAWFFFSFRKNQPGCARHRIVCLPSASARAIRKNMEEKALADSDDTDFGGAGDADLLERI